MPQREALLRDWLGGIPGLPAFELVPVSGDASFRRYFRLHLADGRSLVAMDAPPGQEDCRPFVDITMRLQGAGVHVPRIQAQDLKQGFLLLEDLGDRLYLDEMDEGRADDLYRDAMQALLAIQQARREGLPKYDRDLLMREMALFPDWLLEVHLGLSLSAEERGMLEQVFERLVENALEQPLVLVHRDYHSRNLLVCEARNPGVIDYQDAVIGPVSYDLVSLLRDCYVRWPTEQVDAWRDEYLRQARDAGLLEAAEVSRFPVWFDLMGAQRHLKAAGIFARLYHRDGKAGYLNDIPRTLGYIVTAAERNPVLEPLAAWIEARVLPGLAAA